MTDVTSEVGDGWEAALGWRRLHAIRSRFPSLHLPLSGSPDRTRGQKPHLKGPGRWGLGTSRSAGSVIPGVMPCGGWQMNHSPTPLPEVRQGRNSGAAFPLLPVATSPAASQLWQGRS